MPPTEREFNSMSPLMIDEHRDPMGSCASQSERRCGDKGFLAMSFEDYLELLNGQRVRLLRARVARRLRIFRRC